MSSDTKTISQLPIADPLTGGELIPVVQNGITKRASIDQIQTEALGDQQFITVDSDPGLPQSRQLTATGGLQFTDNGPLSTFSLTTVGLLNSISSLGASGVVVNVAGTAVARTWVQPAAGIVITNPDGVAGNPTFALSNDLAALEGLSSTGIAVRSAADTWVQRSVDGTANEITVTNGSGVGGNPTISIPTALTFTGKTITGGTFSGGTSSPTSLTVLDSAFTIQDNGDPTKQVKFEASGISPGTTRTLTVPNASDTLAVLGLAQTFANKTLTSPNIDAIVNLTTNGYVKTSGGVGTLVVQSAAIPATDGGTGFASYAVGDILYAGTTTTLAKLPDVASGNALISGGVGVAPSWGKISLTTAISGTLPVANGGTGAVTFTAHGILLGEGTSPIVATAAMTDGQVLVGQTGADPLPKTVSGDVTWTASGAVTIANNAVTNAKLAQAPANTILGNNTGGTANVVGLTSAQVSAMLASPQVTVQTSGSGTYTTPTGAKYLLIELVGGGGGGGGSGTSGGTGGTGTASTISTLSGGGGVGGANLGGTSSGGVSSGGDVNLQGGVGQGADALINTYGGGGGVSFFGGNAPGGAPGIAGTAGVANTGSGGGGGGTGGIVAATGSGGGSGGYCRKLQTSPAATYSYTVGAGGAGGTAGTSGTAGGAGADGLIIITAYFQ